MCCESDGGNVKLSQCGLFYLACLFCSAWMCHILEGSGEQEQNGENWLKSHLWCSNDSCCYGNDDDDDNDGRIAQYSLIIPVSYEGHINTCGTSFQEWDLNPCICHSRASLITIRRN